MVDSAALRCASRIVAIEPIAIDGGGETDGLFGGFEWWWGGCKNGARKEKIGPRGVTEWWSMSLLNLWLVS